jgi:hypothetical protein
MGREKLRRVVPFAYGFLPEAGREADCAFQGLETGLLQAAVAIW